MELPGVREFIGGITDSQPGDYHFTVFMDIERVAIVGIVRSSIYDGQDVELLCAVSSDVQRRGFAREACAAVLRWAATTGKWQRVLASVSDENPPSRALVDRLGFQRVGRRPFRNEDVYELLLPAQPNKR